MIYDNNGKALNSTPATEGVISEINTRSKPAIYSAEPPMKNVTNNQSQSIADKLNNQSQSERNNNG